MTHPISEPTDQTEQDAQYYRAILHEVIDMATDLARSVHAEAKTNPKLIPAFDTLARIIRRNIMLAQKVMERPNRRVAARRQIIREVEDNIQRNTEDAEAETLHAELLDRLDRPDLLEDLEDLPTATIITNILRDLGLAHIPGTHPWKRRTPDDVSELHARARFQKDDRPLAAAQAAEWPKVPVARGTFGKATEADPLGLAPTGNTPGAPSAKGLPTAATPRLPPAPPW